MAGSIRCCNCNTALAEDGDGICVRCKKARHVFLWVYWHGAHHKIREDKSTGQRLEFLSGRSLLKEIRGAIDKARKLKQPFDLTPHLAAAHNPNIAEKRFEEWLEELEGRVASGSMARGTWISYAYTVRNHFLPSIGDKDLAQVGYAELDRLVKFRETSIETAKTHRGYLRAFFNWAWRKGYVAQMPPFPHIKGKDAKTKYVLTRAQQAEGIARLPERYRDLVWLMVYTGGRVSEILVAKISDINPERTIITMQRTYSGGRIKDSTKKNRARTLPLSKDAAELIRRAAGARIGDVWLFPNLRTGMPYTLSFISTLWRKRSGFGHVPLKDATRRSRATSLRNAGTPLDAVRAYLGHTNTNTTQIYLDEDVEWVREELEKAEARILELANSNRVRTGKKAKNR